MGNLGRHLGWTGLNQVSAKMRPARASARDGRAPPVPAVYSWSGLMSRRVWSGVAPSRVSGHGIRVPAEKKKNYFREENRPKMTAYFFWNIEKSGHTVNQVKRVQSIRKYLTDKCCA